jgi:hypothetical protein
MGYYSLMYHPSSYIAIGFSVTPSCLAAILGSDSDKELYVDQRDLLPKT